MDNGGQTTCILSQYTAMITTFYLDKIFSLYSCNVEFKLWEVDKNFVIWFFFIHNIIKCFFHIQNNTNEI